MMHHMLEWISAYWRWVRDRVRGLIPHPELPVAVATVPVDRQELFSHLARLRERRQAEVAQYRQEVGALTGQWKVVQAQADALQQQIVERHRTDFCANLDYTAEEDRLLAQIIEQGSVSLALFIDDITRELDRLSRTQVHVAPVADRNAITGKKSMGVITDGPSVRRRAAALNVARQRAREMQTEPLTVRALNAEILRLKNTIPAIETETLHGHRAAILAAQ